GFVKKELAYHGDVINTSARIQGQCNTYNAGLLVSEKLMGDLNTKDFSATNLMGSVLLKGKQEAIKIHTINL
ncbi:MAG: adenylate/guanylate cyclase domain-containing protein, partial [Bacteroidota bacterium]